MPVRISIAHEIKKAIVSFDKKVGAAWEMFTFWLFTAADFAFIIKVTTITLLFGGMHLLSASSLKELLFIIPYGSLGFFFAKAYYETDNIYTSIIMHIFHNSLSIFFILLGNALL